MNYTSSGQRETFTDHLKTQETVEGLRPYQVKAFTEAEGYLRSIEGIMASMPSIVNKDALSRIERHLDELSAEISIIKNS